MPIPAFDRIHNILPPHIGNPTVPEDLTPFTCTIEELEQRFSTSAERVQILKGFVALRNALNEIGITGFQWIGGSFLEDQETRAGKPPRDIDVVTFWESPAGIDEVESLCEQTPWLEDDDQVKSTYHVDHYLLPLGTMDARLIVEQASYWCSLFSHRRDGRWKGMLVLELSAPNPNRLISDQTELPIEDSGAAS